MALLNFLKPKNKLEEGGRILPSVGQKMKRCPNCRKEVSYQDLQKHFFVCLCGHHFRMKARKRLEMMVDEGSFEERYEDLVSEDPLQFPDYQKKLETVKVSSGEKEGVICGKGKIGGQTCLLFAMEPGFLMGSMGAAVGEKITQLFEDGVKERLPVIGFLLSGGARMQEGLLSLMQMAKVSGAVKRHSDANLLYVAVLTDPTTGGVTASFAMEADIIFAEPESTIGFAGARVIEKTTKQSLPLGFQKAEFVLEHGFLDGILPRIYQKQTLREILELHQSGGEHGWKCV